MGDAENVRPGVIHKDGHYEVAPELIGGDAPQPFQEMNAAERDRIIAQRRRYLEFMHDHFADEVIPPPPGAEDLFGETHH